MKIDNYTRKELINFMNKSKSFIELTNSIGFSGSVNSRVKKEIIEYYNNIGYDVIKILKDNLAKSKLKTFICKSCGKEFTEKYSKWSNGDFCSKSCARKYSSSIKRNVVNSKLKEYGKKYSEPYKEKYFKNPKICPICGNIIPYEKRTRDTCSKECGKKLSVLKSTYENCGGYRRGSGRSHHGWYKGFYCDSTYELAYLIYCLDHNIDIKRCDETFDYELNGVKHTYHPDFIIDGIIIKIKSYDRGDVKVKEMSVDNKQYKLLFERDLIPYFEYVSKTYNKRYRRKWNNFYELYDNYKPKYEYTCDNCEKVFTRDRKIKSKHKFCCRSCSGKYVKNNY